MDTPHGKPAESIKRFSLMKWAVAAAVLLLLALTWLGGPDEGDESAREGPIAGSDAQGSSGPGPAGGVAADATLALELAPDGSLAVGGTVADDATRNQWLNEIRIGAQGRRVSDQLKVGSVAPAKADWASHLSSLVAVMRERQLASLRVEGDRVVLQGPASDPVARKETETMIQAQLPSGYRLDSRLASGPSAGGAPRASAGSPSKGAPSPASSPSGQAGTSASGGASAGATASSSPPAALAQKDPGAASADRADAADAGRDAPAGKKPVRKPANCPRQLRPLAQPVYFKTDVSAIPSEDRDRLQRLGECIGRARVRIVGHADPRHTDEYNQELSERRARAVADMLTAAGADPARIEVVGAGKAKAPAKKPSRQALQRARRVDIQIR